MAVVSFWAEILVKFECLALMVSELGYGHLIQLQLKKGHFDVGMGPGQEFWFGVSKWSSLAAVILVLENIGSFGVHLQL